MSKKALGKGLGAIFGDDFREELKKTDRNTSEANNQGQNKDFNNAKDYNYTSDNKVEEYIELSSNGQDLINNNIHSTEEDYNTENKKYTDKENKYEDNHENILSVKISMVEPNRSQPRKKFDEESLTELCESMKKFGVLQPLLVKKSGEFYEIIAGERRW